MILGFLAFTEAIVDRFADSSSRRSLGSFAFANPQSGIAGSEPIIGLVRFRTCHKGFAGTRRKLNKIKENGRRNRGELRRKPLAKAAEYPALGHDISVIYHTPFNPLASLLPF
jgi:hypothetical protein